MKTIKILIFTFAVLLSNIVSAQYWSGTFETGFGTLKLVDEYGPEYPNGGMVYGDYRDDGTILGSLNDKKVQLDGTFSNATKKGVFMFYVKNLMMLTPNRLFPFSGNWSYGTELNIGSDNTEEQWNGKKISKAMPTNLTQAVWSGKWNTTDGYMILQQTGAIVKGVYKGVGTVTARYNPDTKILKGTFRNDDIKKLGFLEFSFEGNNFKGKWGWNPKMTEGNWDGDKAFKTNATVTQKVVTQNANAVENKPQSNKDANELLKYDFSFDWIRKSDQSPTQNIYGIGWCRLFVVNKQSGQEEQVMPNMFTYLDGNGQGKGRVFEIARNNSFEIKGGYNKTLPMNRKVRFQLKAIDYGYDTKDELLDNAYFKTTFEIKEKGSFSDNIFGKEDAIVRLKDAYVIPRTQPQMYSYSDIRAKPTNGLLLMRRGEITYSIFYSFIKPN